jgi:hypothetical protein
MGGGREGDHPPQGRERKRSGSAQRAQSARRKTGETRPPARTCALYPSPREGQSPLEKQTTGAPQALAASFLREGSKPDGRDADGGSVHESPTGAAGRAQYFQLLEILMKETAFINFSEPR